MNEINGTLTETRIIAEGAISLIEKNPKPDADVCSLIREALYMIQERLSYCLLSCRNDSDSAET